MTPKRPRERETERMSAAFARGRRRSGASIGGERERIVLETVRAVAAFSSSRTKHEARKGTISQSLSLSLSISMGVEDKTSSERNMHVKQYQQSTNNRLYYDGE